MKRIIVAGSRTFDNYHLLWERLMTLAGHNEQSSFSAKEYVSDWTILDGGAKGADALGAKFARELQCGHEIYPANWDKYKKSAGIIRNGEMAQNADTLVAFWDGQSKGTRHMIQVALEHGLEVHVYRF